MPISKMKSKTILLALFFLLITPVTEVLAFTVGGSLDLLTNKQRGSFYPSSSIGVRNAKLSTLLKSTATTEVKDDGRYDVIVVGSGNGACALLSECLKNAPDPSDNVNGEKYKILVLEEGQRFYDTSDLTHEINWPKAYAESNIFQLHNTMTKDGRFIISGRAKTMGGGGSINYTMMHESSDWLHKNIGQSKGYWDCMKIELGEKFNLKCPFETNKKTIRNGSFYQVIAEKATNLSQNPYMPPNKKDNFAGFIPSLNDKSTNDEARQLYYFPTQFNRFGQRTNSGVSLVDWEDERIEIKCLSKVTNLDIDKDGTCQAVEVSERDGKKRYELKSNNRGKVILCSGAASPRLLIRSKKIKNKNLGKHVRDHICMPLGVYIVSEKRDDKLGKLIGPSDIYESIFATLAVKFDEDVAITPDEREICTIDFFSGEITELVYLVSSLYLAYLPFNRFKQLMGRCPMLFTVLSNTIRVSLSVVLFIAKILFGIKDVLTFQKWGTTNIKITTSLIKFNTNSDGQYEEEDEKITLGFFQNKRDFDIAEKAIKENIGFLESIGTKQPSFPLRQIFQFITKIPYNESQVQRYVDNFSKNTLLSEQHLSGGCLFGKVIDTGEEDPLATGRVFETTNLHVADLSTVPLPRVSTQMTAYLVGHYVGKQLFGQEKKP